MATQRYISTSFWDDGWVQSIDPSEKLLYLYLMTNPLTNIAGIYKITDKRIHDDTGFNVDMIKKLLKRFAEAGKAYRSGEYIIIPSWPKHQKWRQKATINTGIQKIIAELPKYIRDMALKVGYQYPINKVPLSYMYSPSYLNSDLNSDLDLNLNSDLDIDSDPDKNKSDDIISETKNEPETESTFNPFFSRISALNDDDDTPLPFSGRTHTENQPEPKPEPPATFEDALNSARMSQENGQRLEQARMLWNTIDTLPKYRYLSIQIPPDNLGPILRMMSVYSDTEITQAIKNYADILSRPDLNPFPRYGNFATFMGKGVEMYCDDAKPYDRCKKTSGFETAQEREERERQAALAYSRKLDEEYEQQQLEAAR
jgi:hypothetical protein